MLDNEQNEQEITRGSKIESDLKTSIEQEANEPVVEEAAPIDDVDESETDPEESASSEEEQEEEEQPKKSKGGFQKRIDKLTKRASELERQLEEARNTRQPEPEQQKTPTDTSSGLVEPNIDDFETYAEYNKALVRYEAKVIRAEEKQQEAQQRIQQELAEAGTKFTQKLEAAKAKYEDFDDVFDPDLQISGAMQAVMLDSDVGADLAYYLSKNPNEAAQIAAMHPIQAARKMAFIEAKIQGESSSEPVTDTKKVVSKAPAPIKPIKKGNSGDNKSPEDMSFDEYKVWYKTKYGK